MAVNSQSYKKLFSNTIIFAIGSFGSKLLVLILVPLYTAALSPEQYGTVDLVAQTANILLPIFTLSVSEAALRFGLDARSPEQRKTVYTTCLAVVIAGLGIMAAIFPLLSRLDYLHGFAPILYIYVWTAALKQLNATYVRSLEKVRLFAFDGILTTLEMILFNILFLLKFKWGMTGYLLAIILSDLCSSLFLFFAAGLWRHVDPRRFSLSSLTDMLKYCAPLVPTTLLWLVTSISDRFIITYFHGEAMNGINTVAYKIPTIITTVFTMFSQAWNMSAIQENDSAGKEEFYTSVFSLNQAFMYVMAAGILLINRPLTYVWVNPAYHEAMLYSPILTLATVFTCYNVFLGSVYIAQKRTKRSFATSLAAGIINIILNFLLIPRFGIYGAALATFAAYFAVFFYRLVDTRKIIHYSADFREIAVNTLLLCAMAVLNQFSGWYIYAALAALFLIVFALHLKELLNIAAFIIPAKIRAKLPILKNITVRKGNDDNGRTQV